MNYTLNSLLGLVRKSISDERIYQHASAVFLAWITPFARKVLGACRKVPQGRTTTYRALAEQVGQPRAARAVGGVMAANPIPLIVPCHRVLRSDGGLGGFSGPGGNATKLRLLEHEKGAVCAGAS